MALKIFAEKNRFFIGLGIIGGFCLVFVSLVESKLNKELSGTIVAVVNDRAIDRDSFTNVTGMLNDERDGAGRPPVDEDVALDRMIDEELLVQKAVALGLHYSDKIARGYLIHSMLNIITNDVDTKLPDKDELKAYFKENKNLFVKSDRMAVSFVYIAGNGEFSEKKANQLKREWAVGPESGIPYTDEIPVNIPSGYLKPGKLADYIGAKNTEMFAHLEIGSISDPFPYLNGWLVGKVTGKKLSPAPEFDDVEKEVLAVYQKALADEAVNLYLKNLRRSAVIKKYDNP